MSHCTETRKRLNEQAALDYEQRTGLAAGYWPAHLDGVAVTLDAAGRVVWPTLPPAAHLAAVADSYDMYERAREDSTDLEDALLMNLPHDEPEDQPGE